MRGGHYTAYVKVRAPQRRTDQHHKNLSGQGPSFFCILRVLLSFLHLCAVNSSGQFTAAQASLLLHRQMSSMRCRIHWTVVAASELIYDQTVWLEPVLDGGKWKGQFTRFQISCTYFSLIAVNVSCLVVLKEPKTCSSTVMPLLIYIIDKTCEKLASPPIECLLN